MIARLEIPKKLRSRNEASFETTQPVAERAHDVLRHTRGNPLDVSVEDAVQLALRDGEWVLVRSRHGEVVLPVRIDPAMKPCELFSTFHTTHVFLNRVTGVGRDKVVGTPEYKVTDVNVEKVISGGNNAAQ